MVLEARARAAAGRIQAEHCRGRRSSAATPRAAAPAGPRRATGAVREDDPRASWLVGRGPTASRSRRRRCWPGTVARSVFRGSSGSGPGLPTPLASHVTLRSPPCRADAGRYGTADPKSTRLSTNRPDRPRSWISRPSGRPDVGAESLCEPPSGRVRRLRSRQRAVDRPQPDGSRRRLGRAAGRSPRPRAPAALGGRPVGSTSGWPAAPRPPRAGPLRRPGPARGPRRPNRIADLGRARAGRARSSSPTRGTEATARSPPIARARSRAIASPRPVPLTAAWASTR